ncbi:CDP-alcohol phosphatidyltransferase family protein [Acidobacteriota bacterium]
MDNGVRSIANMITLSRMILVPLFIGLTIYDRYGWAVIVFVTAGVTDALDGYLARRLKQETYLGSVLDPIADKILIISGIVTLSFAGTNPIPKWLAVTVISRDALITLPSLCILLIVGKLDFKPTWLGKSCTAIQITTLSFFLLFNYLEKTNLILVILCWITMAATVSSGSHYLYRTLRWMAAQNNDS